MSKNIVESFTAFAGHYANEAKLVASGLAALLDAVRPNNEVSTVIQDAIDTLTKAATNLENMNTVVPVTINREDVNAAVAAVLPDMVAAEVAKQLEARQNTSEPDSQNPTEAPASSDTGAS